MSQAGDGQAGDGQAERPETLGRRRFVQRLAAEATTMAGRAQGLSHVLVGSIGAAGQAVVEDLEMIRAQGAGSPPGTGLAETAEVAPADPVLAAPTPAPRVAPVAPTRSPLGADHVVILADAREAVVAVNDAVNGPHLGVVPVAWDGRAVVFAAIGHSRRATLLRADDRLALSIDAPDDTYLILRGRVTMLAGVAARDALGPLLVRTGHRWDELVAEDSDRLAVLLVPDQVMTAKKDTR